MKWTIKDLQLVHIEHRQVDGVWQSRTVTIYGDVEVTLSDEGITHMGHRALGNASGKSQDGDLKSKVLNRTTETSDWRPNQ